MPVSAHPPLPAAVEAELARLEERVRQLASTEARQQLAELGEATAARVLRTIGESPRVRTLSGFIKHMAEKERMKRNARGIPTAHSAACLSGPSRGEESVSVPLYYNVVQTDVQSPNHEIASGFSNHAMVENQAGIEVDTPAWAMASPVSNNMAVQLNSPTLAMAPTMPSDVMMQVCDHLGIMQSGVQNRIEFGSPIQQRISTPRRVSTPSPVRALSRCIENMSVTLGSSQSPLRGMPQMPTGTCHAKANALREAVSPQMLVLEELEFRKIFMIFAYLSCDNIEDVLSVDYIRSLKFLPMAQFESQIWSTFGHKNIAASDRAKNLDSDPGMTKVYHCNVEIRGDTVVKHFKGPYVENVRTHLQKVVGDDNVLVVKFMEKPSGTKTNFSTYCQHYHNVAEDGIVLGLRRYRFFVYKDGGKEEKMKEEKRKEKNKKCTSTVRCYFVRIESGWSTDEPYILSGRTVDQARKLFMHIHTAPTLAKYMARLALVLSKTITLDVDLSAVHVRVIDDEPCLDEYGNIVLRDGEPLIHTDGTGLISEDLALKCPTSVLKGKILKPQDIVAYDECETMMRPNSSKRHRSLTTEHPLLTQFRLFYNGSAVKGTVLVDRQLSPGTILIRPSMIKIKTDPELSSVQPVNSSEIVSARNAKRRLSGVQSVNSFEIVSTSNRPRRTLTSRYLIALLHHGGVPEEYFMELLQNAIEGAENARYDYEDALKIAFSYADMEDSMSARMILSGIPLEETYLQSRLAFMARQERKGIKQGKIPIDECYYLMGTTDPTGTLRPNEVCVILEKGQLSGDVLVYKHPGLHFGDIHVLKATYIRDLEKDYVGYSKYAILFPTSGQRSLADEMANSDFDGDMYWVSNNPKLLEHYKPSEPWVQTITPKKTNQMGPQDIDESKLERLLFHEFLKARFTPSYALSKAADSWLVFMDRLLTCPLDEGEEKLIQDKIIKLVDLYYFALDAPKTGNKVNIGSDLKVNKYPHFMGRSSSYHSTSILGKIYDKAVDVESLQSDNVQPAEISFLPCFAEREAPPTIKHIWQQRYEEYLADSKLLCGINDKEQKNTKFEELYEKYKHMLYYAPEFEQTARVPDEVFTEACVIYQLVYEKARSAKAATSCCFAWKVAGRALCHFYVLKNAGDTALCSLAFIRKIIKKDRR